MIDFVGLNDTEDDFSFIDTDVKRAENILNTQLDTLTYAPDFGIDLEYFLNPDYVFQNEAFRAYLLQRLSESSVNVTSVIDILTTFTENITFNLGQSKQGNGALMG
jgi:hypothetical protein